MDDEEKLLRSVALQNANAVLLARERAEQELLKAKEDLQQTTDRLSNILESITDGFISFDSEWRIVFVNRRAEELLRPLYSSKENLLGLSHWEAFPDTVGTPLEENYRRALRDQVSLEFENFYPPLRAWFDIRVYPSPRGVSVFFQDITARKGAQEALRQQHEWFAVTLASIGDAVITTDTEGKVTFLNPVAEAMTGWKTVEASGKPLEVVFHIINERTRQPFQNPIQKVLREGKVVGLANHTVLLTRDGREIAIEDSAAPIRNLQGKIAGAVMVFHDVTERRRAENALRQSEGRFSALVQATAQIVWVADSTGGFVEHSPSWQTFTGQTFEQMKGWGRFDVIHPDDQSDLQAAWKQAFDAKTPLTFDYRVRHVSGDWRWTTMRAAPMLAVDGSIRSWVGMNTDITGRKRITEALRQNEETLRATFNQAAVGIAIASLDGHFLEANRKFADILGYSEEELKSHTFLDLTHPEDLAQSQFLIAQLSSGRVPDIVYEKRYVRKNGAAVWSLTTVTLLKDDAGQPLRYIGVIEDITSRKEAEIERERLAAILERSLNEIYIFDTETLRFQYVNEGARRNLGYSLEELRQMTPLNLKPEFSETTFREMVRPLLSGELEKHRFFTIHLRADGSSYPVEVHLQVVAHAGARVFAAIILDITDRKKSEEALRRSEEELRALANSIPQLAWMAGPDGNIFWYNRRWYEYTGTTLEQMQGWGWQAVHDPKMLPSVLEAWEHSLATGQAFDMEFPLRGADGAFRWFLTRVNPVHDEQGRVVRWFGTNTDVEAVRRVQESLRDETRVLELLNDTGTAIASKLDLQDLVQTVTDAATKLCGARFGAFFYNVINDKGESFLLYTLSGAPREAFEKFGMPRNTPIFNPTFTGQGVMRSGDITKDPRYGTMPPHHGMPRGHLPVCSYLAVPVISRNREVIGGLFFGHPEPNVFTERAERLVLGIAAQAAVAIDNARLFEATQLSERKLAEANADLDKKVHERTASLQQAITQMEEFSYSVSHDLRAPVRAIQAYANFMRDDFAAQLPAGANDFLNKIALNTDRMNRLINDVLSLSKLSRSEMRLQPISVHSLLAEIIEQHPQMQPPKARIEVTVDVTVIGDEISLSQALSNLLTNAVKFVPRGVAPEVKIWSEARDGKARIWVEDNGIGIKPEHRSKLFGMFQRLQNNPIYDGTGVGLAIVKKAVERMGGSVGVESDGIRGSRFWIELKQAPG